MRAGRAGEGEYRWDRAGRRTAGELMSYRRVPGRTRGQVQRDMT
jgi:hypothetical protein